MAKWAVIEKDHDFVTKRTRSGAISGMLHFKPSTDPVSVTQAQLESIVAAEAGKEVDAPADTKAVLGKPTTTGTTGGRSAPAAAGSAA